ncbi:MAG: family 43 glycosylhydrolase [Clostridia bacterium]|nr:family 43 glycosylhydrolase [Clostridia bacterium]
MKKQAFNPYLPSWEYIPDGEPHVFGDRVYVYGSHDFFNGYVFCMGDYMGWSAPVSDLSDWRCEGVIFPRNGDPVNAKGKMCLYAPDVTRGPDGRYYLYYVYDKVGFVSVAVCDSPVGLYRFLGYVHYPDGTRLGDREGDEPQFDPGVLTEGDKTYLYTGFCPRGDKKRHGAMCTVLGPDMVTVAEDPVICAPGCEYEAGTGFEGHAYFEAASIRKRDGTYYFIYSSTVMHELCYATSSDPRGPFRYGGVIVSNNDIGIDAYKPAGRPIAFGGNNHGSIAEIGGKWYVFYHRQTNGTWYSRQGCAEPICFDEHGNIAQVPITSCGLNGGPLRGEGEYPAYIACHLFVPEPVLYAGDPALPRITQDGRDGDPVPGHIAGIRDGTVIGFRSFDCRGIRGIYIRCRGYAHGSFAVRTAWNGPDLVSIPVRNTNVWEKYTAGVPVPDGTNDLYLVYSGTGSPHLGSIGFVL